LKCEIDLNIRIKSLLQECHSLFQKYVCYMMRWNTKKIRTCT